MTRHRSRKSRPAQQGRRERATSPNLSKEQWKPVSPVPSSLGTLGWDSFSARRRKGSASPRRGKGELGGRGVATAQEWGGSLASRDYCRARVQGRTSIHTYNCILHIHTTHPSPAGPHAHSGAEQQIPGEGSAAPNGKLGPGAHPAAPTASTAKPGELGAQGAGSPAHPTPGQEEPRPAREAAQRRARRGSKGPAPPPPPPIVFQHRPRCGGRGAGRGAAYIRRGAGAVLLSLAAATRVGAPGAGLGAELHGERYLGRGPHPGGVGAGEPGRRAAAATGAFPRRDARPMDHALGLGSGGGMRDAPRSSACGDRERPSRVPRREASAERRRGRWPRPQANRLALPTRIALRKWQTSRTWGKSPASIRPS